MRGHLRKARLTLMATVHPEEVVLGRTDFYLWMYTEGLFTDENRPAADVLQGGFCMRAMKSFLSERIVL